MSSKDATVYIMRDDEEAEWVRPTPAGVALVEALTEATTVDEEAVDDIDAYLDLDELRAVLDGDRSEPVSFTVEGHDVTIDGDGEIEID